MLAQTLEQLTRESLQEASKIIKGTPAELRKTIGVAQGLFGVNLQKPAHQLVPIMSPFRQSIPRMTKPGSNSDSWKNITALNSPRLSTAENAAANLLTMTVTNPSAPYKVSGVRGQVTREAQAASMGFDDALAKETANTLLKGMQLESQYQIGGNITALATPGAPTVTERESIAGATIGASSFFVSIAALTLPASNRVTIERPADYDGTDATLAGVAHALANINPESDGVTVGGAEGTVTTTGTLNSLKITWSPVAGAASYAVFVGTATGAANLKCEAIVTQTSVTLTSLATTGAAASTMTATSADALAYDGILAQLNASGSGAYLRNLNNKLSQANGEIVEIQEALAVLWVLTKIGKYRIVLGGMESRSVTKLGFVSGSANLIMVPTGGDGRANFTAGAHIGSVINASSGDMCPIETDPWLPGGLILFLPMEIPYPDANISAPFQMVMGYDWERWDYASTTTTGPIFPFEVRCWGVLEGLFTAGCGLIFNVFKG